MAGLATGLGRQSPTVRLPGFAPEQVGMNFVDGADQRWIVLVGAGNRQAQYLCSRQDSEDGPCRRRR